MVTKFQARHGTLAYIATAVTWDTSTEASDETFTGNVAEVKNITLSFPEQSVDQVQLLGATAQTIGANARTAGTATGVVAATFQNSLLDIKSVTNWKISGTAILTGDEQFLHILGLDSGAQFGGTGTEATRYAVGNLSSNNWAKPLVGSFRFFLNNGSEEINFLMTNSAMTKIGDVKPTGSDGHFEVDFEAECLPKDGAIEYLN